MFCVLIKILIGSKCDKNLIKTCWLVRKYVTIQTIDTASSLLPTTYGGVNMQKANSNGIRELVVVMWSQWSNAYKLSGQHWCGEMKWFRSRATPFENGRSILCTIKFQREIDVIDWEWLNCGLEYLTKLNKRILSEKVRVIVCSGRRVNKRLPHKSSENACWLQDDTVCKWGAIVVVLIG